MTKAETNIAVIVLAAGDSSRLGKPKQLLPYAGKTLLQYSLQIALNSIAHPVIVVLGAQAADVKNATGSYDVQIVMNNDWQEGMASSIRSGINALLQADPLIKGVVLMLCDQPYVTAGLINDLVTAHDNTGNPVVASSYNDTLGAPALFHKSIFPELLQLKGDVGAKAIIKQHAGEVEIVAFSKGSVDIDSTADYEEFLKNIHQL